MPYRSSLAPSLSPSSREDVDGTGCCVADEVQSISSEADEVGDEVHADPSETVEEADEVGDEVHADPSETVEEADEVVDEVQSDPSEIVEGDSVEVPSAAPSAAAVVRSAAYCRGIRCQCLGALAF